MSTSKKVELSSGGGSAEAVVRDIAKAENKFQEELNRAFTTLAEGSFKGLRRQLPVTRQRVEWEKIGGYRVSRVSDLCCLTWCCNHWELTIRTVGSRHRWWTVKVSLPMACAIRCSVSNMGLCTAYWFGALPGGDASTAHRKVPAWQILFNLTSPLSLIIS